MWFRLFLFGALALGSIQTGGRLYAQTGASFRKSGLPGSHGQVHANHGKLLPTTLAWNPAASTSTRASAAATGSPVAAAPLAGGAAAADDLANIARACQNDPVQLFDFVANNIRFQPYFGFRKGAQLTWLSRSGNDADQAELLVSLLHAAGFPQAQYEYGRLSIPTTAAYAWFGVNNDTALDEITGSAGYPEGVSSGTLTIEMVWASVSINATTYRLMPAYKTFTPVAGIDLTAATGYSLADLHTAAGGTQTANYVQGVSTSGVTGYLAARALSLVNAVRTSYPNASVDDIVGARAINPVAASSLTQAFPAALSVLATAPLFTDPDATSLCETVELAVGPPDGQGGLSGTNADVLLTSRDVGGGCLSLSFAADGHAQLWVDDTLLAEEPAGTNGSLALGLAVNHPYYDGPDPNNPLNLYDESRVVSVARSAANCYGVLVAHGGEDTGLLAERRRTQAAAYQRAGLSITSRQVVSESLYLLGLYWARQWTSAVNLLSCQRGFMPIYHHTLAIFSQTNAVNVDIPATAVMISSDGDLTKSQAALRATLILGSAAEHACIEANYPALNAVSTVRYVTLNNAAGQKTYLATSANYASIQADADFNNGWGSYYVGTVFPGYLSSEASLQMIIPQNGVQHTGQLVGNGYFLDSPGDVAAIISDPQYTATNGGHSTTPGQVDPNQNPTPLNPTKGPENGDNPESDEPVDLYTGAYVSDHADLTLDGASDARQLALVRTYSSEASSVDGDLGPGWSHGYHTSLAQHADLGAAFGQTTPVAATTMIAVGQALGDLMLNDAGNARGWVIAAIAADWATQQLRNNAVTVVSGRRNLDFLLLADGSYAPAAGTTAQLLQDGTTHLFRVVERFGRTTSFDAQQRVSTFTDADGQSLAYAYDATQGTLSTVTDAFGRKLSFGYTGAGAARRLQNVSDSSGRSVAYGYDAQNRLGSVTDPDGGVSTFTYDAVTDKLLSVTDENAQPVVTNTYDSVGRVISQMAEGDSTQVWNFAFTGLRNAETNPAGNTTLYLYDGKGRQTGLVNGAGESTVMAYDGQDQLIASTNGRGHTTGYQYDGLNNLHFLTDANGHTTELDYNAQNQLSAQLDAAGKKTQFGYDTHYHLASVTDAQQRLTTYQFYPSGAATGLLWKVIAPGGDTTALTYDANGQPATTTRPDASVVTTTYNALGDLLTAKITTTGDPNVHALTLTYNKKRQLLTSRDALGFGVTNGYDARGRLKTQTDRFGNVTRATFSPWGRLQTSTSASGALTTYHNDSTGRRDQQTDALNERTGYAYDGADRLKTLTDALQQPTSYGYDASGNPNALTNPRAQTWAWLYTPVNLLNTLTSPLGRVTTYGYEARELLQSVQEPSGHTTTLTYWDDQRLKQTVDPVGTIAYGYDGKGRLSSVTEGAKTLSRQYDHLDRLSQFTDGAGNVVGYTYDGAGNLSTLTYPGGQTVAYVYDAADRLDHLTDWAGRVTRCTYDTHSRLAAVVLPNGTQRLYGYDAAGRVSQVRDEVAASHQLITGRTLVYDALDRVAQEEPTPEPASYAVALPTAMTYDNDDRLATWGGQSCASDPDGNLTKGPLGGSLATLSYDARHRLTGAGTTTTYTYDAENRRVSQSSGGVSTSYVHDPQGALSRLLVRTQGATVSRYVYAADGGLLYEESGSATRTYHFDARGSTVALSDGTGNVSDQVVYGPYGETVSRTGTSSTPFLFHGAWGVQTDANALLYMRARYYSVESRRFLNADPLGFGGGLNWYAFVGGDPVNATDSSGLSAQIYVFRTGRSQPATAYVYENNIYIGGFSAYDGGFGTRKDGSPKTDPIDGTYNLLPKDNYTNGDGFVNGTPSITGSGLPAGEPVQGDPAVFRVHAAGLSDGCLTTPSGSGWDNRIWDIMNRNMSNGGTQITYESDDGFSPWTPPWAPTLPAPTQHSWPVFNIQGAEPVPVWPQGKGPGTKGYRG